MVLISYFTRTRKLKKYVKIDESFIKKVRTVWVVSIFSWPNLKPAIIRWQSKVLQYVNLQKTRSGYLKGNRTKIFPDRR